MKKLTSIICLMALAVMALASIAQAGERAGAFSISPFVGGYGFDDDRQAYFKQNRPLGGLRLGYDFTDHFAAELVGTYMKAEYKATKHNVGVYSYRLDLVYNILADSQVVPYLAFGGGGTTIRDERGNSHDGTAEAGGGVKFFMTDNVALRADGRYLVDFMSNHLSRGRDLARNWEYSLGLTFLFGGRERAAAPAETVATPVEQPAAVTPAPEPPLEVPAAEPTPDHYKYCITLHGEFDIDKAIIRPEYKEEIAQVGNFMKKYPTTTAVIEGHTDNVGSYNHNQDLSQRRAEAVVNYLVEQYGIERSRLSAKGYGFTRPIADNATDEGKQKNRRIEAIIDCAFDVQQVTPPDRLCMALVLDFDAGKADVKSQYRNEIAKVADYMKRYNTTTAVIEGHTDNTGSPEKNMKLSQQRAQNVVNYLVDNFGIERSRLSAKGYGATRRISYNNTPEGRQKNRRINAVIDCVVTK
ncbi:peptidoglycan-binding outer membrane protein, OMP_b-brl, OmpA and OmpA domain-containing [Citrifermentans bemidjiense Bem]|uniref:Peptidoglycan-binding outer membrane protein, OMP_b-brl, OmpA and OmpA domain-containing n=1 Tax=Citrifermentans bemidjiense (strain ATCC BAA-1014 / DSM 16622 / JCM 12645 / Bem) TaxID=404380 RepID=B5EIN0_CITBB|nr:OmpA family protein [Citrifermentans bemidjiense]ACH38395.1 peptidoglycan-binding outer membrane protein, OMP_b-brl, OmpA and OmpA domain-containing [Citrifermentans bemidjiense Bem]